MNDYNHQYESRLERERRAQAIEASRRGQPSDPIQDGLMLVFGLGLAALPFIWLFNALT